MDELASFPQTEKSDALRFAEQSIESAYDGLTDMLDFYDVRPYKCENNKFDPLRQVIVKAIPTTDESLFKLVERSLGFGYERKGVVIAKERVVAYKVENHSEGK